MCPCWYIAVAAVLGACIGLVAMAVVAIARDTREEMGDADDLDRFR